jgi:hypothetical protein
MMKSEKTYRFTIAVFLAFVAPTRTIVAFWMPRDLERIRSSTIGRRAGKDVRTETIRKPVIETEVNKIMVRQHLESSVQNREKLKKTSGVIEGGG